MCKKIKRKEDPIRIHIGAEVKRQIFATKAHTKYLVEYWGDMEALIKAWILKKKNCDEQHDKRSYWVGQRILILWCDTKQPWFHLFTAEVKDRAPRK